MFPLASLVTPPGSGDESVEPAGCAKSPRPRYRGVTMEVACRVAASRAKMSHMSEQRGDELIGVSRSTAARVIGINERRLRAWNDRGLVSPSLVTDLGSRSIWTFSLEDLVQGRVVRELEERGISVRHIRRVVEAVRSSTHQRPLASLVWGVAGHEIFVGYPDDIGAVESRRGKLGSKDVFSGTRIPVAAVVEYIERGASDERILQGFPDLRSEDIDSARRLAS